MEHKHCLLYKNTVTHTDRIIAFPANRFGYDPSISKQFYSYLSSKFSRKTNEKYRMTYEEVKSRNPLDFY